MSPMNKKIIQVFREKEVYADMTEVVEFILTEGGDITSDAPFTDAYIENDGNFNETYKRLKDEIDDLQLKEPDDQMSDEWIKWYDKYYAVEEQMDALDLLPSWFYVSPFLGEYLREEGEQIIDCIDYVFWAIPKGTKPEDQEVLSRIAAQLGILEGQSKSWAKYMKE